MDGYRQTLLGRALADALREMEGAGEAARVDGDAVFALFDEAVRAELAAGLRAASRRRKRLKTGTAASAKSADGEQANGDEDEASGEDADVPVFTHRSLELDARLRSFNRFEDRWSLQASVRSGGLRLDHVPVRWGGRDEEEKDEDDGEEKDQQQHRGEGSERVMLVKLQQLEGSFISK